MGTREAVLVGTDWLRERIGDPHVRVVEVDVSPAAYDEGHIQGAVLWNVYRDLKDADYRTVDTAAVERLLERSGITRDTTVVFYGYAPAMGFWFMKLYGHPDVRILDSGRETARDGALPWTKETARTGATDYPLGAPDPAVQARLPEVRTAIDDGQRTLVDVRTEEEFRGERFWPSGGQQEGGRAGRVPTAVHVPLDGLYDDTGAFRGAAELRQVFAPLDLGGPGELITYCTIGGRASTAWFVLTYLLDRPSVRVYDGSWAEWGMTPAVPVAVG
jgi:thiosulfate/3-mercaptopyruvate sulfurtransferase